MSGLLPYQLFDCDTHIAEQEDAFTRYMEPRFRDQAGGPLPDLSLRTRSRRHSRFPTS